MSGTTMPPARRADIEMAMAVMREDLNRALQYRTRYDTEKHNICLGVVNFRNGPGVVLAAYSHDSAIPESIRLGLGLVPDTYAAVPAETRFGCDGMPQYHTEPKLLNFLAATPEVRRRAVQPSGAITAPPGTQRAFVQGFVANQRAQAAAAASRLDRLEDISSLVIASEIDCCVTCTRHSIHRFRARFPSVPLRTVELGKAAGQATTYTAVTPTVIAPGTGPGSSAPSENF
ncbi:hypothetical protein ACE7GA_02445 [Roseomonas sp. CCTCC AB2023176]|uniref:hypothetical protein n=1 Tax=Roseomonas sp. CCTCC AB2023176 TaxID=3342640 RepID=UPI0035DD859A